MNPIIWLLTGAAAGWLTSIIISRQFSPPQLMNILAGMGGAFTAGTLIGPMIGLAESRGFSFPAFLVSLGGAVFLLLVVNFVRRNKNIRNFNRRWLLVSDKIQTRWGKLTDDDVTKIDGSYTQLTALLKARYGSSSVEADDQIQRYLNAVFFEGSESAPTDQETVSEHLRS